MNNAVCRKVMENVRKHRDIKLVTTKAKRIYLVSEPNYQTKFFLENLVVIEMKKKHQIFMNKPVYLGLSILEISKIVMYEFSLTDYLKPKYEYKAKLFYMDTESFIVYMKTEGIYIKIAKDVETRFETSKYEQTDHYLKEKIKK